MMYCPLILYGMNVTGLYWPGGGGGGGGGRVVAGVWHDRVRCECAPAVFSGWGHTNTHVHTHEPVLGSCSAPNAGGSWMMSYAMPQVTKK